MLSEEKTRGADRIVSCYEFNDYNIVCFYNIWVGLYGDHALPAADIDDFHLFMPMQGVERKKSGLAKGGHIWSSLTIYLLNARINKYFRIILICIKKVRL